MSATGLRDPLIRLYLVVGAMLLPLIVLLAEAYPGYEERMRRAAGPPQLQAIPPDQALREQVAAVAPGAAECEWQLAYAPEEEPATGIARAYDLLSGAEVRYRLLIVRHDIACGVCRDLLVGMLYDAPRDQWTGFLPLAPFERKGETIDPGAFLAQFAGQPPTRAYAMGVDVDGITGATKSVKGFINRLQEVGTWLVAHPAEADMTREARP